MRSTPAQQLGAHARAANLDMPISDTVMTAAIAALGGGVGVKLVQLVRDRLGRHDTERDQALTAVREQVTLLREQIQGQRQEMSELRERIVKLEGQLHQARHECGTWQQRARDAEARCTELQAEVIELRSRLNRGGDAS